MYSHLLRLQLIKLRPPPRQRRKVTCPRSQGHLPLIYIPLSRPIRLRLHLLRQRLLPLPRSRKRPIRIPLPLPQPIRLKPCPLPKDALIFFRKQQPLQHRQGMQRQTCAQKSRAERRATQVTPHPNPQQHQGQQGDGVVAIPHMQKRVLRTSLWITTKIRAQQKRVLKPNLHLLTKTRVQAKHKLGRG
jgi:hypothetical protein